MASTTDPDLQAAVSVQGPEHRTDRVASEHPQAFTMAAFMAAWDSTAEVAFMVADATHIQGLAQRTFQAEC